MLSPKSKLDTFSSTSPACEQFCLSGSEIPESVISFISCLNTPLTIYNHETQKFVFVNEQFLALLGLNKKEFYSGKQEYFGLWIEDDDYDILKHEIGSKLIESYSNIAAKNIGKLSYMINFRLKKKDASGANLHMLVQSNVLAWIENRTSKNRSPKITLDIYSEIGHRKHSNKIVLSVKHLDQFTRKWNVILDEEFLRIPIMLANREKQILKSILEDKSSTIIAEEKGISVFTVRSHWRNILLKTNCESKEQLKMLALEEGWV